ACLVGRCELFDGVAEHRARHHRCMPVEESGERRTVLVADAAEHPSHRLVAQVLLVLEQQLCDGKRLVELTPTDETEGCEDGSAARPQALGPGKLEEDGAWPVDEPGADDMPGCEVNEIPVVDAVVTTQIEVVERLAALVCRRLQPILFGHYRYRGD